MSDDLNLQVPTPALAAGGAVRFTNVVTVPPTTPYGTYYLWVVADDVDNSSLNQSTRADDAAPSAALTVAPVVSRPNLVPQNIRLGAYSLRPGDLLPVMWTIANVGDGNCGASLTGLHLGTSATEPPSSDPLDLQLATPEIPAHSSVRQTNSVTIPPTLPAGNYYLWVVADDVALSTIDQTSRADDASPSDPLGVTSVPLQPNLVSQNVTVSSDFARPGDVVTVHWILQNIGAVTCPASLTGLRLGQSPSAAPTNATLRVIFETPEIAAGASLLQTNTITIPATASLGTNYIWIVADDIAISPLNQSSRLDDAAPSGPLLIVNEFPQPNLVPLGVTLSTSSAEPGAQVMAIWTISNSGNSNCPASVTGLHLGTSATAPPTNEALVKLATPAIGAQTLLQLASFLTIPTNFPAGTYYLWVMADDVTNSVLNQSSTADDAAVSGPLVISTPVLQPNLVTSEVKLSAGAVPPGSQIVVTWTTTNAGNGDCPASTTGIHLGLSATAPPATDALNVKLATPALAAQASFRQTNAVTIPANTAVGQYYVWIVADDTATSGLNQSSKSDDAARSGLLAVSVVILENPSTAELVAAPPAFRWTVSGIPPASLYLANKASPVFGTDPVVYFDQAGGSSSATNLQLSLTNWAAAVSVLGYSQNYYWTVGSSDLAQRQIYTSWRPFKSQPVLAAPVSGSSGNFSFQIVAPNQAALAVETSLNLTNWVQGVIEANVSGTLIFTDPTTNGIGRRFYRVRD